MAHHNAARAALTFVRLAVVVFSFVCFGIIARERCLKFIRNGIIQRSSMEKNSEPWFDMAMCFGPRIPSNMTAEYMNTTWSSFPDRYTPRKVYMKKTDGPGIITVNSTTSYKIVFDGSMSVDSVRSYREFFGNRYNWTDDVLGIVSQPSARIHKYLSYIQHAFFLGAVAVTPNVVYTDIPYLFHYSICRNYSFRMSYFHKGQRLTGDFVHQVSMNETIHNELLRSGVAQYIDLYVYPRGDFTEFPLLADHVPYRVDLSDHKLLDVMGQKTSKRTRPGVWECSESRSHSHVNCLTWCLMRGLLDKIPCIMPMMVHYIYNTTGRLPPPLLEPGSERTDLHWKETFPASAAWPWMTNYTHLELCDSSEHFKETFQRMTEVLYPRGRSRYPLSPNCATECLPECSQYDVIIKSAGSKLIATDRDMNAAQEGGSINGVTLIHATSLGNVNEHWMYSWKQLSIDLSGVLSFLLGLSMLAIHDWCFTLSEWVLQKVGIMEAGPIVGEADDDISQNEDKTSEASQEHMRPLVMVEAPSGDGVNVDEAGQSSDNDEEGHSAENMMLSAFGGKRQKSMLVMQMSKALSQYT